MSVFKFMNLSVQQVVNEVSSLNTIVFPIESDAGNEQSLASTEAELFVNCNTWKNPFQLQLAKMLINLGYRLLLVRVNYNDSRTNIRIVNKDLFSYFDPKKEYEYHSLDKVTNIRDITETLGTLTKRLYYNECEVMKKTDPRDLHSYLTFDVDKEEETHEKLEPYILIKGYYTYLVIFTDKPELYRYDVESDQIDDVRARLLKYPAYTRYVVIDSRTFSDAKTLNELVSDFALRLSTLTGFTYDMDDEMVLFQSDEPTSLDIKTNFKNAKVVYNQLDDFDEFTSKLLNDPAMILISKQPDSIEDIEVEITNISTEQISIKLTRVDSTGRSLYSESYVCDRDKGSSYSVESMLSASNLVLYLDAGIDFYTTDISGKYKLRYSRDVTTTIDNYIDTLSKLDIDEDLKDVAYITDSMIYKSITEYWSSMKFDELNRPYGFEVSDEELEAHKNEPDYEFLKQCNENYNLYGKVDENDHPLVKEDKRSYNDKVLECNDSYQEYKDKIYEYHKVLSEKARGLEAVAMVSDPPYKIGDYFTSKNNILCNLIYFTPNMIYGPYVIPTYYVMLSLLADSRYNGDVSTTMDLLEPIEFETSIVKCVTEFIDYQYLINDGYLIEEQVTNSRLLNDQGSHSLEFRSLYYVLATYIVKKFVVAYIDDNFIGNYSNVDFTDLFDKLQDRFDKIISTVTLEDYYTSTNTLNATILITYKEKNKYIYKFNINLTLN